MVGIPSIYAMDAAKCNFKAINRMISIYDEQDRLEHINILLSFFTPCPLTRRYDTAIRHGLIRLTTLEEWGDFDQFDFNTPWTSKKLCGLVLELRSGTP